MTLIAPSILTTDFSKLSDTISMLQLSEADWIHLDNIDKHWQYGHVWKGYKNDWGQYQNYVNEKTINRSLNLRHI